MQRALPWLYEHYYRLQDRILKRVFHKLYTKLPILAYLSLLYENINRAWLYKETKVSVLQANAKLVQKGECWTWNQWPCVQY